MLLGMGIMETAEKTEDDGHFRLEGDLTNTSMDSCQHKRGFEMI